MLCFSTLELPLFHSQNNCMYLAKAVHDSHCPNKITGICSLSDQADSWTKEGVFHQTPCSKEFKVYITSILPTENQSKVLYRKSFINAITFLADNMTLKIAHDSINVLPFCGYLGVAQKSGKAKLFADSILIVL